jgi:hypothetical protein
MVVKRITRTSKVDAWVGDEERLNRLVRILEGLVADEKGESGVSDDSPWAPTITFRQIISGDPELVATATERGGLTIRGVPHEVFGEMDRSAVQSLELEVSPPGDLRKRDQVRIEFHRVKGVSLESRGETKWIDEAHTRLTEELDRGRPWWWWMRGDPIAWVSVALILSASFVLSGTSLMEQDDGSPLTLGGRALVTLTLGLIVSLAGGVGVHSLLQRVLPGFEVVLPGGSGRGARALGVIGAIILAALGIVATFLAPN